MITKEQFSDKLSVLQRLLQKGSKLVNFLQEENIIDGYPVISYHDELMENYLQMLSILVNDQGEWVSWYVWENDFGERKMEAGFKDEIKPIENSDQLYDLIQKIK